METIGEHTAVLILAAGASSRMGSPKQILPWKGTHLLDHTIDNAKAVFGEGIVVVLGANANEIKSASTQEGVRYILNKNWRTGLGSSIAHGVDYIQRSFPDKTALLIMLCDQPLLDAKYIMRLIQTFKDSNKGIVATAYSSGMGVPAIFDQRYFSRLAQLNEDFGAKRIIQKFQEDSIRLNPLGLETDIDTPEDYQKLTQTRDGG